MLISGQAFGCVKREIVATIVEARGLEAKGMVGEPLARPKGETARFLRIARNRKSSIVLD